MIPQLEGFIARLHPQSQTSELSATLAVSFYIAVIDEIDRPLPNEPFIIHQDGIEQQGTLDLAGRAFFLNVDEHKPFKFEVPGRVCAIARGAWMDKTDDPASQYAGLLFDWKLADDDAPAPGDATGRVKSDLFWTEYSAEPFLPDLHGGPLTFWQHEHITRRSISIRKEYLRRFPEVHAVIKAIPVRIRTGPMVRFTNSNTAVIWIETETPAMVRVRYKLQSKAGDANQTAHAATVLVGGRNFGMIVLQGLKEDTRYAYTVDAAPLPAIGEIPTEELDLTLRFPKLSNAILLNLAKQMAPASVTWNQWLVFRTLPREFKRNMRFAYGSCRKPHGLGGLDALDAFGSALGKLTGPDQWPHFMLFIGDQIYADDISDEIGELIVRQRFASRAPPPMDGSERFDGAWAGRFAHRAHSISAEQMAKQVAESVSEAKKVRAKLIQRQEDLGKQQKALAREHARTRSRDVLKKLVETAKEREKLAKFIKQYEQYGTKHDPERAARWVREKSGTLPTRFRRRIDNHLLWAIPVKPQNVPTVLPISLRRDNGEIHPSAGDEGGVHCADFSEFSFLYEKAWTDMPSARKTMANVPTFMIFDDHEITDDWNFNKVWVDMLHDEKKDPYLYWPNTISDGLVSYWMYQGWGNLPPDLWESDARCSLLLKHRREGTDALVDLRPLMRKHSVRPPASATAEPTLKFYFSVPTVPPVLVLDGRTERVLGADGAHSQVMTESQFQWLERGLRHSDSSGQPAAFVVAPAPIMLPRAFNIGERASWIDDPGAVDDIVRRLVLDEDFLRSKDVEHWAGDTSWDRFKDMVGTIKAKTLKTVVVLSGDVHFSYNLRARPLQPAHPTPDILQLVCSPLRNELDPGKNYKARMFSEVRDAAMRGLKESSDASQVKIFRSLSTPGSGEWLDMDFQIGGFHNIANPHRATQMENSIAIVDVWFTTAADTEYGPGQSLLRQVYLTGPDLSTETPGKPPPRQIVAGPAPGTRSIEFWYISGPGESLMSLPPE